MIDKMEIEKERADHDEKMFEFLEFMINFSQQATRQSIFKWIFYIFAQCWVVFILVFSIFYMSQMPFYILIIGIQISFVLYMIQSKTDSTWYKMSCEYNKEYSEWLNEHFEQHYDRIKKIIKYEKGEDD